MTERSGRHPRFVVWAYSGFLRDGGAGHPSEMEDLGVIAVQLALNFPEWVRRRRFVVSYINDTTIQQRMSIDFVLPRETWFWSTVAPTAGSRIYVPLYLPAKETLDQFTAFDEGGRRLTMLPTADNGALAVAGLLPLVRGLATERLAPSRLEVVLPLLEAELTKVVMAPRRPDAPTTDAVLDAALCGPLGEVLTEDDQTKAVVQDLAGGFLMLVPVEYRPGVDRLLKAEWNVPNYWIGQRGANGPMRWAQSFLASIGWADKRQNIPNLQIGWSRSTHVEVVAPEDVDDRETVAGPWRYSDGRAPVPVAGVGCPHRNDNRVAHALSAHVGGERASRLARPPDLLCGLVGLSGHFGGLPAASR